METVVNYNEEWVKQYLDVLLEKMDVCKCERCKRDMYTLALNNLKPHYASSDLGKIMTKIESTKQQVETNIVVEVTKAIKKVAANPNHGRQ